VADGGERPSLPVGAWLLGIAAILVGGWILLTFVFTAVRAAIALLGYLVVAVVAYYVGKSVGRASGPEP
jgi:hypothetical protein